MRSLSEIKAFLSSNRPSSASDCERVIEALSNMGCFSMSEITSAMLPPRARKGINKPRTEKEPVYIFDDFVRFMMGFEPFPNTYVRIESGKDTWLGLFIGYDKDSSLPAFSHLFRADEETPNRQNELSIMGAEIRTFDLSAFLANLSASNLKTITCTTESVGVRYVAGIGLISAHDDELSLKPVWIYWKDSDRKVLALLRSSVPVDGWLYALCYVDWRGKLVIGEEDMRVCRMDEVYLLRVGQWDWDALKWLLRKRGKEFSWQTGRIRPIEEYFRASGSNEYFFVDSDLTIRRKTDTRCRQDNDRFLSGNYFRTEDEAEVMRDRMAGMFRGAQASEDLYQDFFSTHQAFQAEIALPRDRGLEMRGGRLVGKKGAGKEAQRKRGSKLVGDVDL